MTKAMIANTTQGTTLIADGGFTCIRPNIELVVGKDNHGLFVSCDKGHHYLDGQLDDGDIYIGFSLKDLT